MSVYISRDKLDDYRLNLLLIHDTYTNNKEFIDKKVDTFLNKINKHNGLKSKVKISNSNLDNYTRMSISYSLFETGITQMYHLFEQFLKMYFNVDLEKDYKKVIKIANQYDYNLTENEYHKLMNKYRLLNNAIKHGGIINLEKEYPSLVNQTYNDNDYGTILDNKLNITEVELDECCSCLYSFVDEMNTYFEDMGYIEMED